MAEQRSGEVRMGRAQESGASFETPLTILAASYGNPKEPGMHVAQVIRFLKDNPEVMNVIYEKDLSARAEKLVAPYVGQYFDNFVRDLTQAARAVKKEWAQPSEDETAQRAAQATADQAARDKVHNEKLAKERREKEEAETKKHRAAAFVASPEGKLHTANEKQIKEFALRVINMFDDAAAEGKINNFFTSLDELYRQTRASRVIGAPIEMEQLLRESLYLITRYESAGPDGMGGQGVWNKVDRLNKKYGIAEKIQVYLRTHLA